MDRLALHRVNQTFWKDTPPSNLHLDDSCVQSLHISQLDTEVGSIHYLVASTTSFLIKYYNATTSQNLFELRNVTTLTGVRSAMSGTSTT